MPQLPFQIRKPKTRLLAFTLIVLSVSLLMSGGLVPNWVGARNHYVADATALNPNALAIDGSDYQNNPSGTNSTSTPLTTSESPDVIIAFISVHSNVTVATTISDTFGLSWTLRYNTSVSAYDAQVFEWYAISNSPLAGDKIKVSINATESFDMKVFGVAGVNTASPFDSGFPVVFHGGTDTPSRLVTTTNADDMILGLAYINGGPTVTPGSGFSCVGKANSCTSFGNNPVSYAQYSIVSSPQTNLPDSAKLSTNNNWIMIGDALVQDGASSHTSVSCTPVTIGASSTCTANVTGTTPSGTVTWSSSGSGSFSSTTCTLSSGSCQVTYAPSVAGIQTITGTYSGDSVNVPSFGNYSISTPGVNTTTTVTCASTTIELGNSTSCTATVAGSSPTGNVNFSSTDTNATFTPASVCTLVSGSCFVTFQPSVAGSPTLKATYEGDSNHTQSSGTVNLTVQAPVSTSTTTTSSSSSSSSSTVSTTTTTTSSSSTKPTTTAPISMDLIIAIVVAIVIVIAAVASSLFIRNRAKRQ